MDPLQSPPAATAVAGAIDTIQAKRPGVAATEGTAGAIAVSDVAAMVSYHAGASAVAAQLAPWAQAVAPPTLTDGARAALQPANHPGVVSATGHRAIFSIGSIATNLDSGKQPPATQT